ncbi:MAG: hypothetical protein CSA45_05095 [Gammaproteobacteria bacterium]|nr:MAG: hypothetical protein CSA45_05095 [Gammaproteobacteria bacterium]
MKELKMFSGVNVTVGDRAILGKKAFNILQDAIYSNVGLLATHETRKLLVFSRGLSQRVGEGNNCEDTWLNAIRFLHLRLRSDLGIQQSGLQDEVNRFLTSIEKTNSTSDIEMIKTGLLQYLDELDPKV